MEPDYWHQRWADNQIGFHQADGEPLLAAHFSVLGLQAGHRVYVPLCGKTGDIAWLLSQGVAVVGVELSETAVKALFAGLGCEPRVSQHGEHRHYAADHIDIYVGDYFTLGAADLGTVDAIYDRAALVALPPPMRARYAQHLMATTARAPQLLITYDYDQALVDGPPFSVPADEVAAHYQADYTVTPLARQAVPTGIKGKAPAWMHAWHLQARAMDDAWKVARPA